MRGSEGAGEPEEGSRHLAADAVRGGCHELLGLHSERITGATPDDDENHDDHPEQQAGALDATEASLQEDRKGSHGRQGERRLASNGPRVDTERQDQHADAEDQSEVRQVRADDVAHGDPLFAVEAGEDGDDELGTARAEADDDDAHHKWRHVAKRCHPGRSEHELIGCVGENRNTHDNGCNTEHESPLRRSES